MGKPIRRCEEVTIKVVEQYPIDIAISFDTTGSMSPCIGQVRRDVTTFVKELFENIMGLNIALISHGDYCDGPLTEVHQDFTNDQQKIINFIKNSPNTNGGDLPECYELVLNISRKFNCRGGEHKALILIGDDVPHSSTYIQNKNKIDWKNEAKLLNDMGVHVYAVQCLNKNHATSFYKDLASITNGYHLKLDQFRHINDLIYAICFKELGNSSLETFEEELRKQGKMNRNMDCIFSQMLGKTVKTFDDEFEAVEPGRFQVLDVDTNISIKDFVEENGLIFKKGRGFYQWTKTETIQPYKEIVLMDKNTGDLFTGDAARTRMGLDFSSNVRTQAIFDPKYICFIQSTSSNRNLKENTLFLYEVDVTR